MSKQATNLASIVNILWKLLEYYNIDPLPLFRKADMNPEDMKRAGARFHIDRIEKAWELAKEVIDHPCFGLKAVEVWHPSDFGALGYAMLASDTLETALLRMERYHKVIVGWKFIWISEERDRLKITLSLGPSDTKVFARVDAMMSVILGICRSNLGRVLCPLRVGFRHLKPDCYQEYEKFFSCPVHFEEELDTIVFPLKAMREVLPGASHDFLVASEEIMATYLEGLENESTVQRVKKVIVNQLPSGNITDKTVASALATSSRNLRRRLNAEGTCFRQILNDVRFQMARKYLIKENIDMSEIAFLLGFSNQSVFSRAFKRWSGISPRQFVARYTVQGKS